MSSTLAAPTPLPRGRTDPMIEHRPVMLDETLAGLAVRAGGVYVDGTFGRGGHSGAILDAIGEAGTLHALDRDPAAGHAAWSRLAGRRNFHFHRRNFAELGALAAEQNLNGTVDGLLLDLGVSSPQFDDAARGFSFAHDGPLDMRMDPSQGVSAAAWLAEAGEAEIADVLWQYGEERASRRIARRLVAARAQAPILRTAQLAEIIAAAVPGPRQKIHPATRSFQAIRIHINGELDALQAALDAAPALLRIGGRLAVISFHSLEDRVVKRCIRDARSGADTVPSAEELLRAGPQAGAAPRIWKAVSRSFPSAAECAVNPRARSAVLRVAERLA